jgi:4-aminobutyrate aminotransferase-like enzyme
MRRHRRNTRRGRGQRLCPEACYRGDEQGRAIHLLGPLAGKVIRVSPPLVMPTNEADEYLGVMYHIFSDVGKRLRM